MQITCPCCHARFSAEASFQDDAARDLMVLLSQAGPAARPLVTYIGLFRSASRALAWDRALKLASEVVPLAPQDRAGHLALLADALSETCASLDEKRAQPGWKPLTNHNYLKRVLESVVARAAVGYAPGGDQERRQPQSRTGQALAALEDKKHGR